MGGQSDCGNATAWMWSVCPGCVLEHLLLYLWWHLEVTDTLMGGPGTFVMGKWLSEGVHPVWIFEAINLQWALCSLIWLWWYVQLLHAPADMNLAAQATILLGYSCQHAFFAMMEYSLRTLKLNEVLCPWIVSWAFGYCDVKSNTGLVNLFQAQYTLPMEWVVNLTQV